MGMLLEKVVSVVLRGKQDDNSTLGVGERSRELITGEECAPFSSDFAFLINWRGNGRRGGERKVEGRERVIFQELVVDGYSALSILIGSHGAKRHRYG